MKVDIRTEAQDPTTSSFTASRPPTISTNPRHQISFRHPHYPNNHNLLLRLFAPDAPGGGIEYSVAHAACGLISGNRWNGWFTLTTVEGTLDPPLTSGDILCARDYYYHLPGSSFENPYAIVPTFKEWMFPHDNLHPSWQTSDQLLVTPFAQLRCAAQSLLSFAVYFRDQSCRMSAYTEGTNAAHLCPRSEEAWFIENEMSRYNLNPLLGNKLVHDTSNALLLRQDLHGHFDAHRFVFVPKKSLGDEEVHLVTHLLTASRELGSLHHNQRLKPIPEVNIAFLFARFAWSIFTLLPGFLMAGIDRTLIGTTISIEPGLPRNLNATACRKLISGPKSRSQSPTKRARPRSEDGDGDKEETEPLYKQQKRTGRSRERETSQDTEESEDIGSLTATQKDPRVVWLEAERLRSDPQNTWQDEEEWFDNIRGDDSRVLSLDDKARLFRFWGYEIRDLESDEEVE